MEAGKHRASLTLLIVVSESSSRHARTFITLRMKDEDDRSA
jgi:hypothetical protein